MEVSIYEAGEYGTQFVRNGTESDWVAIGNGFEQDQLIKVRLSD
jgi:hypothetical protein